VRKTRGIPFDKFYSTLVIFATIITITAIIYILQNKLDKDEAYLNKNISTLDMAYKASIEKYEILIHYFFETHINNDHILSLFVQGADASGDERRLAKGLLYRELYPLYDKLKVQNISQFRFHLKNNKSYLKFFKPDDYGDDLSGFRNTVKIANKENRIVQSFEIGRVGSGYRYVFPLNYKSRHVGSVEFSLAMRTIIATISHLDSNKEYAYVLKSDVADSKLFDKQKYLYTPSIINPNFVQEDFPQKLSIEATKINEKLKNDIKLQKAMEKGEKYASFVHINSGTYSVSFLPLGGG